MPEQEAPYEQLIIQEIIIETHDTKTFVLGQLSGTPYQRKAGQFLTLVFPKTTGEQRRSYSISSPPWAPLAITVKRQENGEFSRELIDHAKEGDMLLCSGIGGLFVLPEDTAIYKQIFFIVAGSGISPVFSLIQATLQQHPHLSIILIYSNRSVAETIFYRELIELAQHSKGRLIIDFLFSSSKNILKSRLNNSLLTTMLSEYGQARAAEILCYTCGPVDYMDTVTITLLTEGIPRENIRKETFISYVPELTELPPDTDPHKVRIQLKDRTVELQVQFPVSILSQAQHEGIALPYSCASGQCGSCAARCVEGRVWIAYNEVLTERELNQGLVLTCQGFPVGGDVTLVYE